MYLEAEKNPEVFITYYLGCKLNDFQKRVLRETFNSDGTCNFQNLIIAGNRSGKTVLLAMLHLYFDFFKKGIIGGEGWNTFPYQTFNISPISRQSHQALGYYTDIVEGRFSWIEHKIRQKNKSKIQGFIKSVNQNLGTITNINSSLFSCLSSGDDQGAKIQGAACGYLSYDECVQSYHLQGEIGPRFFSRLADYGQRFDLITTPDEQAPSQAYLYHLYQEAKNPILETEKDIRWKVVEGTFYENIYLSEEQKEKFLMMLKDKGKDFLAQKQQMLEGKFIATGEKMFDLGAVHNMWNAKKNPTPAIPGHYYLIVIDWGVAEQGDDTIMIVVDYTTKPYEIVNSVREKGGNPADLIAKARGLQMNYNSATILMDATSLGGTTFYKMMGDLHPIAFGKKPDDKEKGLTYLQMVLNYNRKFHYDDEGNLIEDNKNFGLLKSYYIPEMEAQVSLYTLRYDKKLKQDYVMVLVMLAWYLEYKQLTTIPHVIRLGWRK